MLPVREQTSTMKKKKVGGTPKKLLLICMVGVSKKKTEKNLHIRDGGLHLRAVLNSHLIRYMDVSWTEM